VAATGSDAARPRHREDVIFLVIVILLAIGIAALVALKLTHFQQHEDHLVVTPAPPATPFSTEEMASPPRRVPGSEIARLGFVAEEIVDLRPLGGARLRIVGTAHVVPPSKRMNIGGDEYMLVREHENQHDANAVAVHDATRKVGYLSRAKAATYGPLLDRIGAPAYRVAGEPPVDSMKLWVVLPPIAAVRALPSIEPGKPSPGS